MKTLEFIVVGTPAPQGSKKGFVVPGTTHVNMVESSAAVKPWRELVARRFKEEMFDRGFPVIRPDAPVIASCHFLFAKPRTSKLLFPGRRQGDLDKLARATFDGLVMSGYLPDDSQIQGSSLSKMWAGDGVSAARVIISF